jgi:YD repeat-containing protein
MSESGPAGSVVVAYDDLDRRKQLQVSGQGLVSYGYNLTNAIETITQNGQSATFQYDELGRMTKRTLPNSVSTEWGFDTAGFLNSVISKLNGTPFDSHTYVPDAVGNILQESINGAPANTFGYDDLYRLTSSSVGGVASSWVYDNTGNRTSQTVGGVTTSYTPDDANRLIAVNGVTVTNDANGNVTGDGTKTYSWDVRGRLMGMTGPGLSASFVSDYLGRRLSKTINGTTTTLLNDGADVVTDTTGGVAM